MNWFNGNVTEAVERSKERNAVFLVFVGLDGQNDSQKLSGFLNHDRVVSELNSESFVAIKIDSSSDTYKQFAQIYRLVPVPSIFFIGKFGQPIEIATQVIASVDELLEKIKRVKDSFYGTPPTEQPISTEEPRSSSAIEPGSSNVVCTDGVCVIQTPETGSSNESLDSNKNIQEKLEKAKALIDKKRIEREQEEKTKEKERELERRRTGKDVADLKKWQEEQELKQLREDRKREKMEEEEARKRVLEQIKLDRLERQQKFSSTLPPELLKQKEQAPKPVLLDGNTRIQFKKPDGGSNVCNFKNTTTFLEIRNYVKDTLLLGSEIREFALATTFPRVEFKPEHDPKTLIELQLVPSAVVLIIPLSSASMIPSSVIPRNASGAITGAGTFMYTVFWAILAPLLTMWSYLRSYFTSQGRNNADTTGAQKRASEEILSDNDIAKRRNLARFNLTPDFVDPNQPSTSSKSPEKAGPYKRSGAGGGTSNIHRLHENDKNDEDDNNTWNGNSTQQM